MFVFQYAFGEKPESVKRLGESKLSGLVISPVDQARMAQGNAERYAHLVAQKCVAAFDKVFV